MIDKLKLLIKTNALMYEIYYNLCSICLRLIGLFMPIKKRILFVSFGGKKFNDSPKAIYDTLRKDERYKSFEICWAFDHPIDFNVEIGRKIPINSIEYFLYALSSKIWITNSSIEKGLKFKKKSTIYINTWHGIPLKKIASDENGKNEVSGFGSKKGSVIDIVTAQSDYDKSIFSRLFNVKKENIILSGLPRNDILVNRSSIELDSLKDKLEIPHDKKVILYAPTYREFAIDKSNGVFQKTPIDFKKMKKELGEEYIVLFRAHYEVVKILNITFDDFVYDFSNHNDLNELMLCSDLLITDYSSILFDFSILEKPIILYTYDYELYKEKRGLYFDIKDLELPMANSYEELISIIKTEKSSGYENLKERFCKDKGNACTQILDIIARKI